MREQVPKIRFKGFVNEWKECELNDITDVRDGTHESPKYVSSGHPFVTSKNIKNGEINYTDINYISTEDFNKINVRSKVDKNDILMGMIGTIGNLALVTNIPDFAIKNVALIKDINKINQNYLYTLLQTSNINNQLEVGSDGGTQKFIALNKVRELQIQLPENEEQFKIGEYFKTLDTLINNHQNKYDKLINIKKSMLEKMFPKEGKNVPEIRFKGFIKPWIKCEIEQICSISTGKSNTQDKVDDGKYPFYVRSPIVENSNRYLYDEEAVLTVGDGVGTGKVFHYVNGKYDLHQRVYRMYGFDPKIIGKYFYYIFSKDFNNRVMSMTAKTSVDSVRYEMISKMEILYPEADEQKLICKTLESIDTLINQNQQQLEKLKILKKSLLEKMFI